MHQPTCLRILAALIPVLLADPANLLGADDGKPTHDPDQPVATRPAEPTPKRVRPKSKPSARRERKRSADDPPPCPSRPRCDSSRTFDARVVPTDGESFTRNPATGFTNFLDELARMEEPALQGVSVNAPEERRAGREARRLSRQGQAAGIQSRRRRDPPGLPPEPCRAARLSDEAPRPIPQDRRHAAQCPISDGQSFPGGFLVLTTALLDEPDEATVAGVVAHELAHLDLGHLYGYVRRSKLAETSYARPAAAGVSFDRFFTQQAALLGLLFNPFRPEHESEADCAAVTWLYQEGYDPRALVGYFERLHERRHDQPANPFFDFGRTHPFSLDRRDHARARLTQLRRWRPRHDLRLAADELRHFLNP